MDITEWPTSRITPAWAGKRHDFMYYPEVNEDHPRVGGEKHQQPKEAMDGIGAPPRGRGKAPCKGCTVELPGITPAWAGKSGKPLRLPFREKDHPRVGGEK